MTIHISQPQIGEAEKQAVLDVLNSGNLVMGERVAQLEDEWAKVCQTKYAVAVSSGTAALHLALLAHGIGPGDEVITSPFTFIATTNAILLTGAKPVFVDIELETFCMDTSKVKKMISPNTAAIMPVHLYGHMAGPLGHVMSRHTPVIDDACQAAGAKYLDHSPGYLGTACYSLYATKNVMCGEGGMIATQSAYIAQRCRSLRSHGISTSSMGYNYRMTDLQAALGLVQLGRLDEFTQARCENAAYLSTHLDAGRCILPTKKAGYKHVWHQYTIRIPEDQPAFKSFVPERRDEVQRKLLEAGVGTKVYYPKLATHREADKDFYWNNAYQMTKEVLSLPVHPGLSEQDLETIVKETNHALG